MRKALVYVGCALWLAGCSGPKEGPAPEPKAAEETGRVVMGIEAQKNASVESVTARRTFLIEYLQVNGTVQPANTRVAEVRSVARGRVLDVSVRVGDRVRAGQVLARLDNTEAAEVMSEVAVARAELAKIRIQMAAQARQGERTRRLVEIGAAPQKEYEQSRAESEQLEQTARAQESAIGGLTARLRRFDAASADAQGPAVSAVRAPFGGVVTRVAASPGELVTPDRELFTVADLSQVWVQAEVYEKDLGRIRLGQAARITVASYPGKTFSGKVSYVSDVLDPQTRTAKVRCEVGNPEAQLKVDMFASVQLPTDFQRQAIAVLAGAVQQVEERDVLFIRTGPTTFEARKIQTGKAVDGLLEIVSGLREGEDVVVQGAFHLKSILTGKELGEE